MRDTFLSMMKTYIGKINCNADKSTVLSVLILWRIYHSTVSIRSINFRLDLIAFLKCFRIKLHSSVTHNATIPYSPAETGRSVLCTTQQHNHKKKKKKTHDLKIKIKTKCDFWNELLCTNRNIHTTHFIFNYTTYYECVGKC